jgi:Arc/MetJ-type ribon-helix-helix transcriptional regulator
MAQVSFRLERAEEQALDRLVKAGLFSTRSEAARAAILKYAMDVGVLDRVDIWREIEKVQRRGVSPDQLAKDLETMEHEA